MVDINILCPGDKVRIVSKWNPRCYENRAGEMDEYLGKIMTVKSVDYDTACMFEDGGMWSWYPAAIDEIVDECDIEPATQEELLALLMGKHYKTEV